MDAWYRRKIHPFQDLEAYRLERLRETFSYAKAHSGFYKRRLALFDPASIRSAEDMARLPLTTAQDIRQNPFAFLAVSQDEIHRVVTLDTSGTMGAAKRVFFTKGDLESTVEFFHHGMSTLVRPGEAVFIGLPWQRPSSVGHLLAEALTRLGARPVLHGPVDRFPHAWSRIVAEGVSSMVCIPTQALGLARYVERFHSERKSSLRTALLTTDYVSPSIADAVETSLGCRVFNHYGMTEMGYGGGVDCEAHCGYHLREPDLYFEIVEPGTGTPVPPGVTGEVVFTTLARQGMPLVRYATGDLAAYLPGQCPCGAALPRLGPIRGRVEGRVPTPLGGFFSMADLDDVLFSFPMIVDFEANLDTSGGGFDLAIRALAVDAVPRPGIEAMEAAVTAQFPFCRLTRLEVEVSDCPWKPKKRLLHFVGR